MKQLVQNLRTGAMELKEVPSPAILPGHILVRNMYSVISTGTEGRSVRDARLGYIGKARARKKEARMVLETARTQGILNTYRIVMNRLDSLNPLGYSSAGVVINTAPDVREFSAGDLVACGGGNAVHAEVISVPVNLCVKVDRQVDMRHAAFTTIASVAMQGLRQSDLRLGETCAVIGLGLIGQITVQLLGASGIKAIGIDIDDNKVNLAKELGAELALSRNSGGIESIIRNFTRGYGCDAVIITAGTSSLDPVDLAGRIARQKGKVVIVGSVPTGFQREQYYKKELELRMSCSYGPGRYDSSYEEKGLDYPIGYVRWTENRNMKAFIDLLGAGRISMEKFITHVFDFEKACEAYDLIVKNNEPFSGVLLRYDQDKKIERKVILEDRVYAPGSVLLGMIGAGSFAQNFILPNITKKAEMVGVSTAHGNTALNIAQKYGFSYAATSPDEIICDKNINTVFIATRHNLHAENVLKCLRAGKNIFVEKPLCMNEEELNLIKETYTASGSRLMLGFNRRFSPHVIEIKKRMLKESPKAISYRINAGYVPKEYWTQDSTTGGGRIIGEVCHFIDLAMFIASSGITSVYASRMEESENLNDVLSIQLKFENGSIASISYFSNGHKSLAKEYLEVFSAGSVFAIDDFRTLNIYSSKKERLRLSSQDKGHSKEIALFLDSVKKGLPCPISFNDIYDSTLATFKVRESLQNNKAVFL